jgi:hypothetical protein
MTNLEREEDECNKTNCAYYKYLNKDVRDIIKKCKAAMWTSGCSLDNDIYGIEMSPKKFAKFLKLYEKYIKEQL